ncbi:MAG: FHA domain-containing protein [Actinomycetia bacterium]|nr:FHA domain-containing protein [Actinomycetes bacterium]MCP4962676.1 FHA domain-containing protein [Actinomycetes bacterium]
MDPLEPEPTQPAVAAPTDAWLVVSGGHRSGTRFPLSGELVTAGRHPDSDIFLDDITVSRRHVEIRRVAGSRTIADVGSLNGTYLNGERIDEGVLGDGDEVQIGKFKLVYEVASG